LPEKFTIHERPPNPGKQPAAQRSYHAQDDGDQDSRRLPLRVEQAGGSPGEQADHGKYDKVPHGLFFLYKDDKSLSG